MSANKEDIKPAVQQVPAQKMVAFVVPTQLMQQLIELVRGHVCHRDADPVIQQAAQLSPQEIIVRND